MNEEELFCLCRLCIYGNKEMFKVNREVLSALKQYFYNAKHLSDLSQPDSCFNIPNLS
jgi:hypothetical protein